jgi:hypothetical protein
MYKRATKLRWRHLCTDGVCDAKLTQDLLETYTSLQPESAGRRIQAARIRKPPYFPGQKIIPASRKRLRRLEVKDIWPKNPE